MSNGLCGVPDPDNPEVTCTKGTYFHANHSAGSGRAWEDAGAAQQAVRRAAERPTATAADVRRGVRQMASSVRSGQDCSLPPRPNPGPRYINIGSFEDRIREVLHSRDQGGWALMLFLALVEEATRKEMVSTNDAWDLIDARLAVQGLSRPKDLKVQKAGLIGGQGQALGYWVNMGEEFKIPNTSGNGHSGVPICQYRSDILGQNVADLEEEIRTKIRGLGWIE